MGRNRKAAARRLSVEMTTYMLTGGMLTRSFRGETDAEIEKRLFGSNRNAAAAWEQHRKALLAEDPVPGRRCFGWWRYQRRVDAPPVVEQPDLLRDLGELTTFEESTLAAWSAMAPSVPVDLALDRVLIDPITPVKLEDDPNAKPVEAWPETEAAPAVGAAPQATPAVDVEEEPPITDHIVKPRILPNPWYPRPTGRPAEIEGWE